ncbi:MAG: exosortase/archaeosortase family protein [Acidobacteriaceae bacterium]|nr:exosortase/archaeosortase family protein [Acidobacteriaceae bacterium]MBV9441724.1 exosortase/archaeosortase family protein [Acidobacteriaceae bacterium]
MVTAPAAPSSQAPAPPAKWNIPLIAWFGALLVVCYAPILYRMGVQWATDENMGHGFFVPIISGYIVWQRRDTLLGTPTNPNKWGLVMVIWAALQALIATLGAELFTARLSFLIALVGTILYLGGTEWVKKLAFPLLLLLFMIPIPSIIYAQLTLRLQMLASQLGEVMIGWMGIPVLRSGNTLQLPSQTLDIAEACSGIRSLLSLGFLSLVYAYFTDKRVWMRWALLVATIPIAIGANGVRVAVTGLLSEINTKFAQGAYHEMEGYIVFVVALAALIITHRMLVFGAKKFEDA